MSSQEESKLHLVPFATSSQKNENAEETLDRTETVSVSTISQSYGSSEHMSDFIISDDPESVVYSQESSASYNTAFTSDRSYSSDSNTVTSNELEWSTPDWSQNSEKSSAIECSSDSEATVINSEAEEDYDEEQYPSSAQPSDRGVNKSESEETATGETEEQDEPRAGAQLRAFRVDSLIPNLYTDQPIYGSQCEHMPNAEKGTNVPRSLSLCTFKYDSNH